MINIFGETTNKIIFDGIEFLPVKKYGIIVPNYFVSYCGKILSTQTSKTKILNPKYFTVDNENYIKPKSIIVYVNKRISPELFEEYNWCQSQQNINVPGSKYYRRLTKDPNKRPINIKIHRAVMEAWKPIKLYPPIPIEDWKICPESAKRFIEESAIIDHIDTNTLNNHGDNLRWTTNKGNNPHRKEANN
jgi:hypothetical protein